MACKEEVNFTNVDMHVNDLADFVFTKNINNAEIALDLHGVEDIKDLFFFYLDLFCKGLVLLFGDGRHVNVEDITLEQFEVIQKKMKCLGINVMLDLQPVTEVNSNMPQYISYIRVKNPEGVPIPPPPPDPSLISQIQNVPGGGLSHTPPHIKMMKEMDNPSPSEETPTIDDSEISIFGDHKSDPQKQHEEFLSHLALSDFSLNICTPQMVYNISFDFTMTI